MFFTDYSDMNAWYMNYKNKHDDFQTKVHSLLSEYREFDICKDWFFVKDEFMEIINELKRIPEHGEVVTQNGIDVRTIFDKLSTSIPVVAEELLLRISFSKDHHLSFDERKKEFLEAVEELGYVPEIRERRFSDDVDMFTWYVKYRDKIKGLREKVEFLIGKKKNNNVNVYLIPNYNKNGGKFYTICTNVGEKIDLDGDGIDELLIGIMDGAEETKFTNLIIKHRDFGPTQSFSTGEGYYMYLCDNNVIRMDSWYGSETRTEYMEYDSKNNSFPVIDGGSKPKKIELTGF